MPDLFKSSQTLSEDFLSSGEKASTKLVTVNASHIFRASHWSGRAGLETFHTQIPLVSTALVAYLTNIKARKFTVQILLILNSSPPHFSEADLAILSCTPGRQEAYGLLVFRLKDSHPIK